MRAHGEYSSGGNGGLETNKKTHNSLVFCAVSKHETSTNKTRAKIHLISSWPSFHVCCPVGAASIEMLDLEVNDLRTKPFLTLLEFTILKNLQDLQI